MRHRRRGKFLAWGAPAIDALEARRLFSTIYVDANSPALTPSGASWGAAYHDLSTALTAAVAGDQVHIADGTYKPTTSTDRTISFVLKSGVSVLGAYGGYGAGNPDARDPVNTPTILSGEIGAAGITDNSYHVMTAASPAAGTTLDGLTFTAGNATSFSQPIPASGGGVYCGGGTLAVNKCTFTSNAANGGGGLFFNSASGIVSNCTFTSNTSYPGNGAGGGMGARTASVSITGSTFTSNTAFTGGGGIDGGSLTIDGCTFTSNSGQGGGITPGGASTVSNSTFTSNTATLYGGGISLIGTGNSPLTVSNCTFTRNHANSWGGAIGGYIESPVNITRCLFDGNSGSDGGAVRLDANTSAAVVCTDSIFVGNVASGSGGAFRIEPFIGTPPTPTLTLDNCTIASNKAAHGGAISVAGSASAVLTNSILYGDTPAEVDLATENSATGTATITYSIVTGGFTGTGNLNADPKFTRNPSAGADANWGTIDDDYGDLRLQSISPAIDAGSNAAVPGTVTNDLAGGPRIVDFVGVHDPGAIVDMGAYEAGVAASFTGTASNESFYLRQSSDHATLQLYQGTSASGTLLASWTINTLSSCAIGAAGGNDMFYVDASNGLPANLNIGLDGGTGTNALHLVGTSSGDDLSVATSGALTIGSATLTPTNCAAALLDVLSGNAVSLHSLKLNGAIGLAGGKGLVLTTTALAIAGGQLDLRDGAMVIDYSTSSPIGGWSNGGYSGVSGYVAAGRNGGGWNGSGIVTSMVAAQGNAGQTTIGIAEASSALGISGAQTGQWRGKNVDATSVLLAYTWGGDSNLNGTINGDDYFNIDEHAGWVGGAVSYFNGDFNYDGKVNADDYFLIDSNYNKAQTAMAAPLSVSAPATPLKLAGVALLPAGVTEPAEFSSAYDRLVSDPGELV